MSSDYKPIALTGTLIMMITKINTKMILPHNAA